MAPRIIPYYNFVPRDNSIDYFSGFFILNKTLTRGTTTMRRTLYCGDVSKQNIGQQQTVAGWVLNKRDMGGVIFIDLRDREGVLQIVCNAENLSKQDFETVESLRNQSVVFVCGDVRLRDSETINEKIATGEIELVAKGVELVSQAETLPFSVDDDVSIREDLRIKYRYLDIRRSSMMYNLKLRHRIQRTIEDYLDKQGFISVETPILTKSTPEGARDYLVPSRVHKGQFYALPQSPQIFKQLLMVGGVDRYFQVARCFRDEDLRADRQPEFTQVDLEMAFVEQQDVLDLLEGLFKHIYKEIKGAVLPDFKRLTWTECMDIYGSDKPDLRFDMPIVDITDIAKTCDFSVFKKVAEGGGVVRAINVKGGNSSFTRTVIETLTEKAESYGAKGMAWIALREDGEIYSLLSKFFSKEDIQAIIKAVSAEPGDFIIFSADKLENARKILGNLRIDVAEFLGLRDKEKFEFLIVTDFPQFEYDEEQNRYIATHHPFTMPYPEDAQYLLTDKARIRAQAYDIVLNGVELGSGSVRIHRPDIQNRMFEALGFSQQEIDNRFGFMINAFKYGTPPHAGFAFGLDRLVMLMVGASSLREIIAFPKTKDAACLMTSAPDFVDKKQLDELSYGEFSKQEEKQGSNENKKSKKVNIDVDKIATLSRLSFSNEQKNAIEKDLSAVIGFADMLNEVDTTGIEPTAHVIPVHNALREDEVLTSFDRQQLLSNTKTQRDGYITVPQVIE